MPGPHIPPALPMHPHRRQSDYHNPYQQHYVPQAHSPLPHNIYGYPQPAYQLPHNPYAPQWYPQYPQQPQYAHSPRQYQPPHQSHAPVVVSSYPHMQSPSMNRQMVTTPPIVHSHTPPVHAPMPQPLASIAPAPLTPSVSSQAAASPSTPTADVSTTKASTPASTVDAPTTPSQSTNAKDDTRSSSGPASGRYTPFQAPLPWYSHNDEPFPPRAPRRRRKREVASAADAVEISSLTSGAQGTTEVAKEENNKVVAEVDQTVDKAQAPTDNGNKQAHASTPSVPVTSPATSSCTTVPGSHARNSTIPAVPIIPLKPTTAQAQKTGQSPTSQQTAPVVTKPDSNPAEGSSAQPSDATTSGSTTEETAVASPPAKPKSWAELVRIKGAAAAATQAPSPIANGTSANGFSSSKTGSLADVLGSYSVETENKLAFLEPRGLVNTGNMCYMNSVLQTLVFCIPFYDFLDQVGRRAAHSFKSDTPLVDAMIMFLREFNVIDSATSIDQLRMRLKDNELEQYGDAFSPEYVYDVIRRLPRFAHMRRGHQQDAEEFLGFLLAELHDECAHIMGNVTAETGLPTPDISSPPSTASTDAGWMEVGPKQKSAVTRSSGIIDVESPVTKIFGGKLRSELRVPGAKNSVTLEPYQPLQLDIGAPNVSNIVDALKGLTQSETIQGEFSSARGPGKSATKQVFIETLPPVLILHLKRFQYDNAGGTQKIWKKIGYPLELEIPKEVFPPTKRGGLAAFGGLPKYRLIGVVYHHGKNASGGHYTVDVRRQEGREWVRIDDTIIRRIRSEEVAEGGSEEDPKVLAAALEQHKQDQTKNRNIYEYAGLDEEQENAEEGVWKDANSAGRKWAGVANGTATPGSTGKHTPKPQGGFKDNKVAYILFYQQIKSS